MPAVRLPKVSPSKRREKNPDLADFPLDAYSYSAMLKFSTNPLLFKIEQINGEMIDTTTTVTSVLGSACHKAMQTYLGGNEEIPIMATDDAVKIGYEAGLAYLNGYADGFIRWNKTIENRAALEKRYSFAYFGYLKEYKFDQRVKETIMIEERIREFVSIDGKDLPIPLKGYADHVFEDHKGRIIIEDHKFATKWSPESEIDGSKLLQAVILYFLVYAKLGRAPYAMLFREFKTTENKEKGERQTREYEIVFKDHTIIFDFFMRFYADITDALLGRQVFVPNLQALFDREVSLLAYIHRLDVDEERAKALAKLKVSNITDFLRKKIQKDKSLKRYAETIQLDFVSATTLNYKNMTPPERIKMKLAEHGIVVNIEPEIVGRSVTLYRFEPSVGVKMTRLLSYVKDVEQALATSAVRVLAPIPDSDLIGFEVPNKKRSYPGAAPSAKGFEIPIGEDLQGNAYFTDLREAPHILVAGTTGSGKTVFLSHVIERLQQIGSGTAQLALFDPKMVELARFEDGPNTKVYADDPADIALHLQGLVDEMNRRYVAFKAKKARNLEQYRSNGGRLPYIFVFVDEFGDLIMRKTVESDQIKRSILLLGQKARAAGIHMILTTQRPSVKVVDGLIKANFPMRIAFRTASATDSEIILDEMGAEKLLGKGDMLVLDPSANGLKRLQGYSS